MKKIKFNDGWTFQNLLKHSEPVEVRLPHDAMQTEKRLVNMKNGAAAGFFPGGKYQYTKHFGADSAWKDKSVLIEFEGIYQNSTVILNGKKIGGWVYGYSGFVLDISRNLILNAENELTVIADNSRTPNSRWYTGSGIYRNVNLYIGAPSHISVDGIKAVTKRVDYKNQCAYVSVTTKVNDVTGCELQITLWDDNKNKVSEASGIHTEMIVPHVKLWSDEHPYLYTLKAELRRNGKVVDQEAILFGIRELRWSAERGLLVNNESVKLRGGCIHHDNGILGSCAYDGIEERKIKLLKEAGFNAIRSAHNPASKALLTACDKYGMYVMDEAFDQWRFMKVDYDYSIYFEKYYEEDVSAMIRKDISHPSVIMYSIGNEIGDTGSDEGAVWNRILVDICHKLDASRPVINCINPVVSMMGGRKSKCSPQDSVNPYEETKNAQATASLLANIIVTVVPFVQKMMGKPKKVEKKLKACFDELDIVGLNYAENCYEPHHAYDPKRIMLGSETYPHSMAERWKLVEAHPYVIGDFMWTAMDYLGEAGVGVPIYGKVKGGFNRPYPCVSGGCGAINLLGQKETEMYAAAIAWKKYKKPYIAVRPVNHSGEKYFLGMWRDTDAVHSWSWPGCQGKNAQIEIYSIGTEVELFQNGESLGRKKLEFCKASYETIYQMGRLKAVSYDEKGNKIDEDELISAGDETRLCVKAEKEVLTADGEDMTFVLVSLTDAAGIVKMLSDRQIRVSVLGNGILRAIGNGNPVTEEAFDGDSYHSWMGQMGFYVQSTEEEGTIVIDVSAKGTEAEQIILQTKRR